jgi:hypothetical protein
MAGFFMRGRMGVMLESLRSQAIGLIAQFGGSPPAPPIPTWPKLFLLIASVVAISAITAISTGAIRWRFSLRTLLIVMTLVAIVLGLIVCIHAARK